MAILFFFYVFCFLLSFPELTTKRWLPRSDTNTEHTVTSLAHHVCVYECVCVGMGVTMAFSRALQQEQRGVDDVEEAQEAAAEELGPQWRKGVVNAQKRLQPQSGPEANLAWTQLRRRAMVAYAWEWKSFESCLTVIQVNELT